MRLISTSLLAIPILCWSISAGSQVPNSQEANRKNIVVDTSIANPAITVDYTGGYFAELEDRNQPYMQIYNDGRVLIRPYVGSSKIIEYTLDDDEIADIVTYFNQSKVLDPDEFRRVTDEVRDAPEKELEIQEIWDDEPLPIITVHTIDDSGLEPAKDVTTYDMAEVDESLLARDPRLQSLRRAIRQVELLGDYEYLRNRNVVDDE